MKKYAKIWESVKVWESGLKEVCQKLRKYEKVGLKLKKVCQNLRKYALSWEIGPKNEKFEEEC